MAASQSLKQYIADLKPSLWGRLVYYCAPFRKKVVLDNMHLVFKDKLTEAEIKKLAKSFYSHILKSIKENIFMRFMSKEKIKSKAMVKGVEHVEAIADNNQGILILTGHFGNWEFAPIAGMLNFEEFCGRFYFIRKQIRSRWIEKILFHRFYQAGLKVITKKNALTKVTEALEQNNAVVFVLDQHACVGSKDGIPVDFFGKKAGTYRSLATIARYMSLPVVPAASYREKDGRHVLEFYPPIKWQEGASNRDTLTKNTRLYNQSLESLILNHPEQWLWMHRRWKIDE